MNPYLLLKILHILSPTIFFGTGLGSAYYALRAWRSGQLPVIVVTFRYLVTADWLFTATTAVFRPLSGLAMVYVVGQSLAQDWLLWSLGFYVFAGLCWLPVVWLQIRVRDMAEVTLREARPIEPLAYRYMDTWFTLGWPAFITFIVIFCLMVNKPV